MLVRIAEDTVEVRLILEDNGTQSIETALVGGGILFRCTPTEAQGFAAALVRAATASQEIVQIVQRLTIIPPAVPTAPVGTAPSAAPTAQQGSSNPTNDSGEIALVAAFATVPLDMAIQALANPAKRLSQPATVASEEVGELLLRAFNGRKLIKSKINQALAQANLRVNMDVLQAALDSLVEKGVVKRASGVGKRSGRSYTLYGFGEVSLEEEIPANDSQLQTLLEKFADRSFDLSEFLQAAEAEKILRERAEEWFHIQKREGMIYQVMEGNQTKFRGVK